MGTSWADPKSALSLEQFNAQPSLVRRCLRAQIRWSGWIDDRLPAPFRFDGNRDFLDRVVPQHLQPGSMVYDVGGGKNPVVDQAMKQL